MKPGARSAILAAGLLLVVVGSAMAAFAVARGLMNTPAPAPSAYTERTPCSACPSNNSLDSVAVQRRGNSTLFIAGGHLPSSADGVKQEFRLAAGDVEVVLKPHGSRGEFEIVSARRSGAVLGQGTVAAGVQGGAWLVDISPALETPFNFDIGFWDGSAYVGRIPRTGRLTWTGAGAPTVTGAAPASPSAPSSPTPVPTPVPSLAATDPLNLPSTCEALPNTRPIPAYLELGALHSSGPTTDPRTHVLNRSIGVGLGGSALGVTTPYAIVAVLRPIGDTTLAAGFFPVDKAGTVQLYASSDGTTHHKAVRTFANGAWTVVEDAAAGDLTTVLSATSFNFFWTGLRAGDHFAFISTAGGGCRAAGLDAALQPTQAAS